jgi:hypothetical protein
MTCLWRHVTYREGIMGWHDLKDRLCTKKVKVPILLLIPNGVSP